MKNKLLKIIFLSSFILLIAGCSNQQKTVTVKLPADEVKNVPATATPAKNSAVPTKAVVPLIVADQTAEKDVQIPSDYLLKVVFAQQAPFGNWDAFHEETCEEASMIMADKYFSKTSLDEQIMDNELHKVGDWETANGYKVDLTAAETVTVLKEYYNLSSKLITDVSIDRIKYEISQGNLIIVPAAGRLLGNPNFKGSGPIYHMLVVKGYDGSNFIINDPGTRKGNSYKYSYSTLINAVHDWNPTLAALPGGMTNENMAKGAKVLVVVTGLTK